MANEGLRALPAVSALLARPEVSALIAARGEGVVKFALRELLARARESLQAGEAEAPPSVESLVRSLSDDLARLLDPAGRRAINATGILLHTGLGRAPYCQEVIDHLAVMTGYSLLQAGVESGKRSLREEKIEGMLRSLTGCEAATVVNNNAAATMLILNTLAAGREVVISRGQLIEIGGAFRMTEVMGMSGARLVEVGCTNRTHLKDYAAALTPETGALIHVHTSNYRVRGFASTPSAAELVPLGRERGIPVIDDIGSGALVPLAPYGIADEPLVAEAIRAGVNVACFSGDKLICGPQAGIIVGDRATIARIRKNPFARMFRVDKLTLAALEVTLTHFLNETYKTALPFYRMLGRPVAELAAEAERIIARLPKLPGVTLASEPTESYVGSGSLPDQGIPSVAVVLRFADRSGARVERLAERLRLGIPSLFGRLQNGALLLDMRTVMPEEVDDLVAGLSAAMA